MRLLKRRSSLTAFWAVWLTVETAVGPAPLWAQTDTLRSLNRQENQAGLEELTQQLQFSIPEIPGIPSVSDLLSILQRENVPVFLDVKPGDLMFVFLLDPVDDEQKARAYIQRIFKKRPLTRKEYKLWEERSDTLGVVLRGRGDPLRRMLGLAKDPVDIVKRIVEETDRKRSVPDLEFLKVEVLHRAVFILFGGPNPHITLLEETIHVLEGSPPALSEYSLEFMEAVNDLLQILFFSADSLDKVNHAYTDWTVEEIRALQEHYRDHSGWNPNFQLDEIIGKLAGDIANERSISVNGRKILLLTLLLRKQVPEIRYFTDWILKQKIRRELQEYLGTLRQTQRFSRYRPLFPSWKLPPITAGVEENSTREGIGKAELGHFLGEFFWKRMADVFEEIEKEAQLYAAGEPILFEDENNRTFQVTLKHPLIMRVALVKFPMDEEWVAYLPRELPGFQELLELVASEDTRREASPRDTMDQVMDWEMLSIMHDFLKEERGFGQYGTQLAFKRLSTAGLEEARGRAAEFVRSLVPEGKQGLTPVVIGAALEAAHPELRVLSRIKELPVLFAGGLEEDEVVVKLITRWNARNVVFAGMEEEAGRFIPILAAAGIEARAVTPENAGHLILAILAQAAGMEERGLAGRAGQFLDDLTALADQV